MSESARFVPQEPKTQDPRIQNLASACGPPRAFAVRLLDRLGRFSFGLWIASAVCLWAFGLPRAFVLLLWGRLGLLSFGFWIVSGVCLSACRSPRASVFQLLNRLGCLPLDFWITSGVCLLAFGSPRAFVFQSLAKAVREPFRLSLIFTSMVYFHFSLFSVCEQM